MVYQREKKKTPFNKGDSSGERDRPKADKEQVKQDIEERLIKGPYKPCRRFQKKLSISVSCKMLPVFYLSQGNGILRLFHSNLGLRYGF